MTRTAFAKALGISRERLYQLIAMGMPITTVDEAQEWRAVNTSRRAPTNGQNAGVIQITTKVQPRKCRNRRVTFEATGDCLFDTLLAARLMQQEAFNLVMEASADGEFARLPTLVSIHNKALLTSLAAEKMYREELERRKGSGSKAGDDRTGPSLSRGGAEASEATCTRVCITLQSTGSAIGSYCP